MRTAWGYEVSGEIQPIISKDQFNQMTGSAYANNPRVESALAAASQVIRNYCGWHVAPSMSCTAYPVGGSHVMRLPASYISGVTRVMDDSVVLTDYEWRSDGLLRREEGWPDKWNKVKVEYTAGYDIAALPDLAESICSIVTGVLAISAGVSSESADGVSVSYSKDASSIAAALTSQQKSALEPYRVISSHAA